MTPRRRMPPRNPRRQAGQSFLEYLTVTAFAVAVLATGSPSPLEQLATAIQKYYTDYSFAMSLATIPKCEFAKSAAGYQVTLDTCPDLNNPDWPISIKKP